MENISTNMKDAIDNLLENLKNELKDVLKSEIYVKLKEELFTEINALLEEDYLIKQDTNTNHYVKDNSNQKPETIDCESNKCHNQNDAYDDDSQNDAYDDDSQNDVYDNHNQNDAYDDEYFSDNYEDDFDGCMDYYEDDFDGCMDYYEDDFDGCMDYYDSLDGLSEDVLLGIQLQELEDLGKKENILYPEGNETEDVYSENSEKKISDEELCKELIEDGNASYFEEDVVCEGGTIKLMSEEQLKEEALNVIMNGQLMNYSVEMQMQFWLRTTTFAEFSKEIRKRVIGQPNVDNLLVSIYMYIRNTAFGNICNANTILAAPSGSGKTETYRVLQEYFSLKIPSLKIIQKDLTTITKEGFVGKDTLDLVKPLIAANTRGIGIVFLDEFDKKLVPSTASGGENTNAAVQAQILTLIEGREVEEDFDTNRTMFVAMGAFDMCRTKREVKPKQIGFVVNDQEEESDHFDEITLDDILEIGAMPELIGRFTGIVNYQKLTDEAINKIIKLMAETVSKYYLTEVKIGKAFKHQIKANANTVFGCRGLYNIIYSQTRDLAKYMLLKGKDPSNAILYLDDIGKSHYKMKSVPIMMAVEV